MKKRISSLKIFQKLGKTFQVIGQKTVYSILLMFYAYKRKETPSWAKNIILGAFAYFLTPFDGIPDLTPVFGYTDDIGVLSFGLVAISCYINVEVRENARKKLGKYFRQINEMALEEVNNTL